LQLGAAWGRIREYMTTKKRKKNTVAAARWVAEIEPVVAFAKAHRGFTTKLAERVSERFRDNKKNWRVLVETWLTDNEERRSEPLAGTGIVLIEEANQLMAAWPEKEVAA